MSNREAAAASERPLPPGVFAVNFMRLAGLDKHKARECERIVRDVLSAHGTVPLAPQDSTKEGGK